MLACGEPIFSTINDNWLDKKVVNIHHSVLEEEFQHPIAYYTLDQ